MKNTKKGFTLVELLVVIAIVAILATVAIVGYTSFIDKANTSADQQAVTQMNTLLSAEEVSNKPATLFEAIEMLRKANVDMEDYKPLAKDMYFFWVKELNRVVYTDKNYNIVYPENLVGTTYKMEDGWYSLSGIVEEDDSWEEAISAGVVSIDNGAEFVSLMKSFLNEETVTDDITEIKLTSDIDLRGAAVNFGTVEHNLTITGPETGVTIYGVRNEDEAFKSAQNQEGTTSSYGYGLLGKIASGANVTISNVTIKDAVIDGEGSVAAIAGYVSAGATLNIHNVTIENCVIRGEKKVAALVGYVQSGATVNISGNITIKDTTVRGGREVAGVIAYVQMSSGLNVAADAVINANVDVAADPSYGFTYSDTYTYNNVTRTMANESQGYAAKNGKTYLGVTKSDYWCTVDGLTLESHFKGSNGSSAETDQSMNFN